MVFIYANPRLDNLRSDSRFQRLVSMVVPETVRMKDDAPSSANLTTSSEPNQNNADSKRGERERRTVSAITFKSRRTARLAATCIALIILASVIGYALYNFANRPPIEFRADKNNVVTTTGKTKIAAVSPDGKYLANVQENNNEQSLWLRQVAAENTIQILPPAEAKFRGLSFSPDGSRIFYIVGNMLFQIPALGGSPKKVLENINSNGISFSPDGKQFAFVRYSKEDSSIFIADADGANERQLHSLARPESLTKNPAWSPDGKVIACSVRHAPADYYVLVVQTADGAAAPINSQHPTAISQLAWLPDSKGLMMLGIAENKKSVLERIYQISYPSGETRRITNDFMAYDNFSLTADGHSLLAVREESINHIWTAPGDGNASRAKQLTVGLDKYDGVAGLAWMPDGRILYESKPGGRIETLTINADGSNSKQVLENGVYSTVSPDGRFLVYQKPGDSGEFGLFRLDLSDNTEKRLTVGLELWMTVSPDGKQVIFSRSGEQMGLYRVSIDGGETTKIFDGAAMAADVSPDGKQIAFHLSKGKQSGIVIMPFDGGEMTRIFEADFLRVADFPLPALQWTPDGRALNYVITRDNVSNIWRQPIDGGAPVQVTNFTTNLIFNFAFSPDGSQIALSRGTFNSDVVLIENQK
ncbi:MAG: PD40 domain-containing protein [Acidobacteria bacterium]|jgi:Tol biopolymer transport system component|nr:PD40 domain-containing protein [Acidobacteriota bacterium]